MVKAISIRLPDVLTRELEQIATSTERTKTFLIRKALENYVAEYADYQVAMDRLRDKDDRIISGAELKKRLGL